MDICWVEVDVGRDWVEEFHPDTRGLRRKEKKFLALLYSGLAPCCVIPSHQRHMMYVTTPTNIYNINKAQTGHLYVAM